LSAILLAVFDGLALQKTSDNEFAYDEAYQGPILNIAKPKGRVNQLFFRCIV
jgi:hypothetical protein